jgi:hypothetical protein
VRSKPAKSDAGWRKDQLERWESLLSALITGPKSQAGPTGPGRAQPRPTTHPAWAARTAPTGKAPGRAQLSDERGWETERCRMAQATAPILDSTECDIARSRPDFRFRGKSGRAADITGTTEFDPACVKTHTIARNVENTILQQGIEHRARSTIRLHGAQFLRDVSTCAAGAGVFAQSRHKRSGGTTGVGVILSS